MKTIFLLFLVLTGTLPVFSQGTERIIDSKKIIVVSERHDSLFCDTDLLNFEVSDFVFDSCNFYANKFSVTFRVHNQTKQALHVPHEYKSWYDNSQLRSSGSDSRFIQPGEQAVITLKCIPYHRPRMTSYGEFLLYFKGQEFRFPMVLKYVSAQKNCGQSKAPSVPGE